MSVESHIGLLLFFSAVLDHRFKEVKSKKKRSKIFGDPDFIIVVVAVVQLCLVTQD